MITTYEIYGGMAEKWRPEEVEDIDDLTTHEYLSTGIS